MGEAKSDKEIDENIAHFKDRLERLELKTRAFINTYKDLAPPERARQFGQIQMELSAVKSFVHRVQPVDLLNARTRFSFETFKEDFFVLYSQWKRFETNF